MAARVALGTLMLLLARAEAGRAACEDPVALALPSARPLPTPKPLPPQALPRAMRDACVGGCYGPPPRGDGGAWRVENGTSIEWIALDGGVHGARRPSRPVGPRRAAAVTVMAVFDLDGDGRAELFARDMEGAVQVFAAAPDEVVPYGRSPCGAGGCVGALDADHDGRPDLALPSPYGAEAPPLLAHGLADGAFARDDAVARAFLREGCKGAAGPLFVAGGGAHAAGIVACDRARGQSADQVAARVTAEGAQASIAAPIVAHLVELSRLSPPLPLPAPCEPARSSPATAPAP